MWILFNLTQTLHRLIVTELSTVYLLVSCAPKYSWQAHWQGSSF
jgi:hypothetical protein